MFWKTEKSRKNKVSYMEYIRLNSFVTTRMQTLCLCYSFIPNTESILCITSPKQGEGIVLKYTYYIYDLNCVDGKHHDIHVFY